MNYDPSRIDYRCKECNELPCRCRREYKQLVIETFTCNYCPGEIFYTINKLSEHRLDKYTFIPTSGGRNGT